VASLGHQLHSVANSLRRAGALPGAKIFLSVLTSLTRATPSDVMARSNSGENVMGLDRVVELSRQVRSIKHSYRAADDRHDHRETERLAAEWDAASQFDLAGYGERSCRHPASVRGGLVGPAPRSFSKLICAAVGCHGQKFAPVTVSGR
jgi:hypothetical protein